LRAQRLRLWRDGLRRGCVAAADRPGRAGDFRDAHDHSTAQANRARARRPRMRAARAPRARPGECRRRARSRGAGAWARAGRVAIGSGGSAMKRLMESTQKLGRALMLPIAVLPVAALLLRLGQPDLLNLAPIAAAGEAIFGNLGILFAIGIAVGLARENHGAAGLAGAVAYFISTHGTAAVAGLPAKEIARLSVPLGIICGVVSGALYNRYSNIKLPDYLAFFGGRRFVPIAAGTAALGIAVVFGIAWPVLVSGMDSLTR